MVNVAIVEDEIRSADVLCGFLERYGSEKGREFAVSRFTDAIALGCLGLSFALPGFAYNAFGVSLLFVTMFALTVVAGIAWIVIRCVRHPEYK